jgi:6,7-dimethyl-8-ribityllumazine synthase
MSDYKIQLQDITSMKKNIHIAIVKAEFNKKYTDGLEQINIDFFKSQGFEKVKTFCVP